MEFHWVLFFGSLASILIAGFSTTERMGGARRTSVFPSRRIREGSPCQWNNHRKHDWLRPRTGNHCVDGITSACVFFA